MEKKMIEKQFIHNIIDEYQLLLKNDEIIDKIIKVKDLLIRQNNKGNKVIFAGNGASAAIASHCALDFTKQAKIRSICFNDSAFITAFANDFGYENWVEKAISFHGEKGDISILISSSGSSPNIVNAAKYAKDNGIPVISFSGFEENNPLNQLGDVNFWVPSQAYNIIENIHQIWLLMICDLIIGKTEYSVNK
jgi:D-sedoheptulose 7-phosphate isomerase